MPLIRWGNPGFFFESQDTVSPSDRKAAQNSWSQRGTDGLHIWEGYRLSLRTERTRGTLGSPRAELYSPNFHLLKFAYNQVLFVFMIFPLLFLMKHCRSILRFPWILGSRESTCHVWPYIALALIVVFKYRPIQHLVHIGCSKIFLNRLMDASRDRLIGTWINGHK